MASPFLQPQWSVEEAVLLVQASDNIASPGGDVNTEVQKLSKRLRSGAIAMGLSISNRYRNEEEILRNLKAINTMVKMVDSVEDDYFDCTSLGKAALAFVKDKDYYYSVLDSANEKYPMIKEFDSEPEEVIVVAEPKADYQLERKRRPRISSYHITTSVAAKPSEPRIEPVVKSTFSDNQFNGSSIQQAISGGQSDKEDDGVSKQPEKELEKPRPISNYEVYLNLIRQVLIQNFPRGYRLGSAIELKRFRMAFKALHGKNMTFKDENLESFISNAGFEYDGKVYIAEKAMSSGLSAEIEEFIDTYFFSSRKYIFFKNLYDHFKDLLLDTQIANPEMLKLYLKSLNRDKWYVNPLFIASRPNVSVSILDEVNNYMLGRQGVVTLNQLKDDLDFLPKDKLEHEWSFNNDLFVSNGRNERFHIKSFIISEIDKREVAKLISTALESSPFMTGDQLLEEIRLHASDIFENNPEISNLGIRNALGTLFGKTYSFKNNLISRIENSYNGPDAMVAYCKSLRFHTLSDVNAMAEIIGGAANFYLEKIADVSIRINDVDFIPRESIRFDVEAIDNALDVLVSGSFTPMASISNFEALPTCGDYPWNIFLLESYLLRFSNKYRYIHPSYLAQEGVFGAIVAKDSPIKTFDDLLIQAIGESDVPLDETLCNQYLYDMGLMASRRKNGGAKGLLTKAKECRNKIKHQKN
ncbi:MAG: hypothetical protein NC453_13255 [Muribaculum sp.]|nr:hypothetical protein [Muribaculum sp.]